MSIAGDGQGVMLYNLATKQIEESSSNPSSDSRMPKVITEALAEKLLSIPNADQPTNPQQAGQEIVETLLDEIARPQISAETENNQQYGVGKWEPKQLNVRHREMMRRILEGATYLDIAAAMGLSAVTVSLVCSSAIFKEELKKLESELNLNVIQRAEDLSNEALDKLKVLMRQARSEHLQATCAEKVLGIAGYSKIEKKQIAVVSGEDVIRELNRRRREASEQLGRDARAETSQSEYSDAETSAI